MNACSLSLKHGWLCDTPQGHDFDSDNDIGPASLLLQDKMIRLWGNKSLRPLPQYQNERQKPLKVLNHLDNLLHHLRVSNVFAKENNVNPGKAAYKNLKKQVLCQRSDQIRGLEVGPMTWKDWGMFIQWQRTCRHIIWSESNPHIYLDNVWDWFRFHDPKASTQASNKSRARKIEYLWCHCHCKLDSPHCNGLPSWLWLV